MSAITYTNTQTQIPGWVNTLHNGQPRGYAYESNGRFYHVYGAASGLWTLSTGLTASELTNGNQLVDWARRVFGATNEETLKNNPGEVVSSVWRPGLYYKTHIHQALNTNEYEQRTAEQGLRILIEKLDEILLYIEPSPIGLQSYGHKSRELLILACTEVENQWAKYMRIANATPNGRPFNTNDYVKLAAPLYLKEFKVNFNLIQNGYNVSPFINWSTASPTQSLNWYNAYNKTKHDRENHFSEATLENCLHSIAAAIVMFSVRHGPFTLTDGGGALTALFNQHFSISLENPDPKSFYMPAFNIDQNIRNDLFCGNMTDRIAAWQATPLII